MIKRIMKLFPACIFIYYLFAQVLGFDARKWPENVGYTYIAVEILALCFIIMAATMPQDKKEGTKND